MIHVLLLAYNEEAGVGTCLRRLQELFSKQSDSFRFIIVDDGSKDRTADIVRGLSASLPVVLLQHPTNLGVARGFDTGLRHIAQTAAPDDLIVTMEADNTNDPAYLLQMITLSRRDFDVVCASRYRRGGRYVGFPVQRRLFSLGANWLMRLCFPVEGVRDYTIFFRVYRARAIMTAIERFGTRFIERRGFTANAEILFKVASASVVRCAEVPLVYRYDLKKGPSKMKVGSNLREYASLFSSLCAGPIGERLRQSAALFLAAAALGVWGIGWGLPSSERLAILLSDRLAHNGEFFQQLAHGREQLYEKMEANRRLPVDLITHAESIPMGWTLPPERLTNAYRSFFLRSENADEQKNLTYLAHMRPRQFQFEPYAASYGGAFLYPLGAWYAVLTAAHAIHVTSNIVYYLEDPSRIAAIFIAGRFFNVLTFALTCVVVAGLGRRLGGPACGWIAGVLFLLLPVTSIVNHTMNPYGWATLWGVLMMRYVLRYLDRGESGDLAKAAGSFGLSFGASIAFWGLSLAMPLACVLRIQNGEDWRTEFRRLVQAVIVAGFVFFITNPYLFLKYKAYQGEMEYELYGFPFSFSAGTAWNFFRQFMGFNMGLLAAGASLAAALYWGIVSPVGMFFKKDSEPLENASARLSRNSLWIIAWIFLLGYVFLSMRITDPQHGRHFLPFIAFGALLVARGTEVLLRSRRRILGWMILGLIAAQDVPASASLLWKMSSEASGTSTRLAAGRWINENLPKGSWIGLVASPQPWDTPPFRWDEYNLVFFSNPDQIIGRQLPEYVVVSEVRRTDGLLIDHFLSSRYEVLKRLDSPRPLSWVPQDSLYSGVDVGIEVLRKRIE